MTGMIDRARTAGLALALAAAMPAAAQGDASANAGVNAIYERIAEGIRTGDAAMSQKTYAPDAVFLASAPVPMDRGAAMHELMRANGERLKADGATMAVSYRLVSRRFAGSDTAIDTGYYRVDMSRTKPEPATQTRYNKFLLTAARQPDGTWKITHDASLPASKEAYEAATPQPGLKFDK